MRRQQKPRQHTLDGFAEARLPGVALLNAHSKYRKLAYQEEALWAGKNEVAAAWAHKLRLGA